MEKPKLKQYAVWHVEGLIDGDSYWMLFDELVDAVAEADGRDVYEVRPELLGTFELKTSIVKAKKSKGKR